VPDVFTAPTAALPLEPPIGATIRWSGVAGVVLEAEGIRIAVDPFVTRPPLHRVLLRPAQPDAALVAETFDALDAVFVGHAHYDHLMDVPVLPGTPRVHGSLVAVELCRRAGLPDDRLTVLRDGDRVETGPFAVTAVGSAHGIVPVLRHLDPGHLPERDLPATAIRWPCGPVLAYRIEVGGRALHHHGSAGIDQAALARQAPVDVLLACLAARQGTRGYLARLGRTLQPRVLVPIHHDDLTRPLDLPPRPVPRLDWPGFLAEAGRLGERYGTRLHRLPLGTAVPC
jgi:L-ascorbate metabolism protein UlaG (beta-lactamase superfamily)